jgi:hypothetical protein
VIWLLAAIAVGVWVMAAESIVFAGQRLRNWWRERRRTLELARKIGIAQREAERRTAIEAAAPVSVVTDDDDA